MGRTVTPSSGTTRRANRDEPGVGDHPMKGTDGEPVDVPRAHEGLERLDERVARMSPQGLGELMGLHDGRQVGEEDSSRAQGARDGLDEMPGARADRRPRAVHRLLLPEPLFARAAGARPGWSPRPCGSGYWRAPSREILPLLVRDDLAFRPHRAQEGQSQGARAHARLEHARGRGRYRPRRGPWPGPSDR